MIAARFHSNLGGTVRVLQDDGKSNPKQFEPQEHLLAHILEEQRWAGLQSQGDTVDRLNHLSTLPLRVLLTF